MLELEAQGAHFGSAVEAEQFSPFAGRVIAQRFDRSQPRQRHESQQQKDGFETVKTLGQAKVFAGMAQQAAHQQRWKRQQDAAFGNIKGRRKPRRRLIEQAEAGRQPLQRRGCAASHRRRTIGCGARTFAARRRRCNNEPTRNEPTRSAACRHGTIFRVPLIALCRAGNSAGLGDYRGIVIIRRFFLTGWRTRPARIAFSRVLRFNASVSATSAALAPPAGRAPPRLPRRLR